MLAGHASVALENARLYEAQRREAESATALLEFGRDLAEAQGLAEVAERVVYGTARILSSPAAALWLQGAETADALRLAEVPVRAPRDAARVSTLPDSLLEAWGGRTEPFTAEERDAVSVLVGPSDGALLAVAPLSIDGRWGAVAVAIPEHTTFGQRELELFGGLAQQAKLALQSAAGYETLERTFLSTVEALANALEASDEPTSTHARWITDLALKVGVELGLGPRALKRLELGALFHDIGKLGIPSAILTKPGPLTPLERAVVERHPVLGERILAPISQLDEVRRIVRAAHEHFDGSGYPDSLAGEDIPVESRIVLACDAFHAMTTDRPYRRALGIEEAKRRLRDGAGTQFDPDVVDALLRVLGE